MVCCIKFLSLYLVVSGLGVLIDLQSSIVECWVRIVIHGTGTRGYVHREEQLDVARRALMVMCFLSRSTSLTLFSRNPKMHQPEHNL